MFELADDFRPVPPYLTDFPSSAFLWLGKDTLTPVHHDTTMNLMCQIMGAKQIRLVAPEHWRLIRHRSGVHSWLNWIEDDSGIPYRDFQLYPGQGLCLPCGWCPGQLGRSRAPRQAPGGSRRYLLRVPTGHGARGKFVVSGRLGSGGGGLRLNSSRSPTWPRMKPANSGAARIAAIAR
jgi:Cupin-like domain